MTFPKLEKAIRDACPELKELTFGCRYIGVDYDSDGDPYPVQGIVLLETPHPQTVGEIIGHPIQLQHVLRAIKVAQDKYSISVDENGLFYTYNPDDGCWEESKGIVTFDLTKDLDGQSDETKNFLSKIICP